MSLSKLLSHALLLLAMSACIPGGGGGGGSVADGGVTADAENDTAGDSVLPSDDAPVATAEELGNDVILFIRACEVWAVANLRGERVEEMIINRPPDHCITGVGSLTERMFVVSIVDRPVDGYTTGTTYLALVEAANGQVLWVEPVAEGFPGDEGTEIYIQVVAVDPHLGIALVSAPYFGGASGGTLWVEAWQLQPPRQLGGSMGFSGAFSPDGLEAAIGTSSCHACGELHWYANSLAYADDLPVGDGPTMLREIDGWDVSMAFSPDGNRLALITLERDGIEQSGIEILNRWGAVEHVIDTGGVYGSLAWTEQGIYLSGDNRILRSDVSGRTGWKVIVNDASNVTISQ